VPFGATQSWRKVVVLACRSVGRQSPPNAEFRAVSTSGGQRSSPAVPDGLPSSVLWSRDGVIRRPVTTEQLRTGSAEVPYQDGFYGSAG
jgi:hypothetical protein